MGAIYGLVGNDGSAALSCLESMRSRLSHRGTQYWERNPAPNVYLGEIKANGNMSGEREELPVVVDLSIFNEAEEMHQFSNDVGLDANQSAAAMILGLFRQHGPDCFEQLNGDFVIALWDFRESRLVLARDPLGTRPLYYYCSQAFMAFASEYKALLAIDKVSAAPDLSSLQRLQDTKYLSPERTLFESIHQVPAGHWLEVRDFRVHRSRYWRLQVEPRQINTSEAARQLRDRFFRAVERRMNVTGPFGVALSGGIDSASIVAAVRQYRPADELKTFTIGSGPADPEVQMARLVADEFNTDHHEMYVQLDRLLDDIPLLIWHLEDPVGRTEAYLQFSLVREASRHVQVLLGGYASDGLFAGMPKHKLVKMAQITPVGRDAIEEFYDYTQTSRPPRSLLGRLATRIYFGPQELPAPRIVGAPRGSASPVFPPKGHGLLNSMLKKGVTEGVSAWMPRVEKLHAAHKVEFRSPFTDPDLIHFAFELPERLKMYRFKEKYILRRALLPLLPSEIANRPKFPQRMNYDLELSDVIDALAERYLDSNTVRNRGFFRESEISALRRRASGQSYTGNRAMRLWTAIVTELWARIFIENRGAPLGL